MKRDTASIQALNHAVNQLTKLNQVCVYVCVSIFPFVLAVYECVYVYLYSLFFGVCEICLYGTNNNYLS